MQQQMGVAIVGFAAYRDDEGKLCTFEYAPFHTCPFSMTNSYTAFVPRMTEKTPFLRHTPRILNNSLENGGNGFCRRVI